MVRPSCSSRRNSGQVAQSPTRLELAMSTRGAHSCVRSTPTGRPDCTSIVSSSRSVGQRAHHRVEAAPVARRPAGAAVDDQVVGALGDLRVEVVLQHPQRRLGLPAAGGERRAARGPYGSCAVHGVSPSRLEGQCRSAVSSGAGRRPGRRPPRSPGPGGGRGRGRRRRRRGRRPGPRRSAGAGPAARAGPARARR